MFPLAAGLLSASRLDSLVATRGLALFAKRIQHHRGRNVSRNANRVRRQSCRACDAEQGSGKEHVLSAGARKRRRGRRRGKSSLPRSVNCIEQRS